MPPALRVRRRAVVAGVAAVVGALAVGGWLLSRPGDRPGPPAAAAPPPAAQVSVAAPTLVARPKTHAHPQPGCMPRARPFTPTAFGFAHVGRNVPVIAVPKDAAGVPGTPPLSSTGKEELAWAPDRAPGTPHGNVLLNAHTWPDGSALGNRLLAALHPGDRIDAVGAGVRLCYRVTERVEVPASTGLARYYATTGPPQLAIVVCSGTRLGPGDWTMRTIWFASPVRPGAA